MKPRMLLTLGEDGALLPAQVGPRRAGGRGRRAGGARGVQQEGGEHTAQAHRSLLWQPLLASPPLPHLSPYLPP